MKEGGGGSDRVRLNFLVYYSAKVISQISQIVSY